MIHKLWQKYNNLSKPVKASLWFLICGFLQKAVTMLTTPIFTRIMTDAEYGRFAAYNSWLGIVQIIASLNLAAGVYTRGLIKNEADQDRFSSSMLGLSTTCIFVWSGIYTLFNKKINDLLGVSTALMAAMFVETWTHAVYQFWSNRERVFYRYKKLVSITLAYVILRPIVSVICVIMADTQYQVEARVIATLGVNVTLFTGLYVTMTQKGRCFFDKEYWLYALRFNVPLLPHYLSQIILNQSDRLMINYFCGPKETAYYTVAYTIAMGLQILNTSISSTMNPWIYRSIKHNQTEKIASVSYSVLLIIAVMNIVVILAGPEILKVLAPENYSEAVWVIPPVTASVYFMFLYNLFATFEYYFEKTRYVSIATVSGAVLNVVLNALAIPKFGFIAAGYTTLFCYVLYAFAHYCFMRKVCREYLTVQSIYNAKIIVGLGAGLIGSALIIMLLYKTIILRYTVLFIIVFMAVKKRQKLISVFQKIKYG